MSKRAGQEGFVRTAQGASWWGHFVQVRDVRGFVYLFA
jgi:hypothetical protein